MKYLNRRQKDLTVAFGLVVFVICTLAFFKQNQAYKNYEKQIIQDSALVEDSIKLKEILVDTKVSPLEVRESSAPKYERKFPKRHFNPKQLGKFIFSQNDKVLGNLLDQFKQTPVANADALPYDETPVWNLHVKPQNDSEFQLFLDESIIFTLHRMENHIEKDELGQARLMAGAWWGLHFFKTLNFAGYDKEGRLLVTAPSTYAQLKSSRAGSRTPANTNDETSNLFAMKKVAENEATIDYDAELESYKYRRLESSEADVFVQKNVIIFEEMIGRVSRWIPIEHKPDEFHDSNLDLEKELIEEIQETPKKFGYNAKQAKEIYSIADIEFSHISDTVARKRAAMAAVIGGGLTALFTIFQKMIQNSMAFGMYVVTTIGIEGAMVIITSIQGMKQLHMLHKYYTFMYAQKVAGEINKTSFSRRDTQKAREKFTDNIMNAKFAKEADILIRRVWASSLALGFTLKYLSTKHPEKLTTRFHRVFHSLFISPITTGLATVFMFMKNNGVAPTLSYQFAKAFLKFKMIAALPIQQFAARVLHVSVFEKILDKIMNAIMGDGTDRDSSNRRKNKLNGNFKSYFKRFATAALKLGTGAIGNLIAGITAGIAMHFLVYTIVTTTADEINKIHISPGHNFQLALIHTKESAGKDFATATREVFYPLCALYAMNSKGSLSYDPQTQLENRKTACLKLIAGFEKLNSTEEARAFLPRGHRFLFEKNSGLDHSLLVNDYVEKALQYPSSYKNTWLAAIRSIYPLTHVSNEFWQLKVALLLGVRKRFKYFGPNFGYGSVSAILLGPDEVADLANHKRLLHAVEFFAEKNIYESQKPNYAEENTPKAQIIKEHRHRKTDLTGEFLAYFSLHKEMFETSTAQFLKLEENHPDSIFGLAISNIVDSFVVSTKATFRAITIPFNSSLENVLEAESLETREITRYF